MLTGKKNINHLDVIRYPVVTEKSTNLSAHNQVTFAVSKTATKPEIKEAIEAIFGVSVKAVNTLIRKGKTKRFKGRVGVQEDIKKAIITLNEGQQLDLGTGI
ncbi:MAG: 50S ribosomal protein L23 [Alphaproteobacteria bacterium]|jgi:large subunit ribosomal protein L23|nr:50S ribosomal protein L23 [Alphaproteobacteria bacterium]